MSEFEPPGPVVIVRLSVDQAVDVFEAYKASRFARPRVSEIVGLLGGGDHRGRSRLFRAPRRGGGGLVA